MRQIALLVSITVFLLTTPTVQASTIIELPIEEDTYIEEKFPTVSPWNNRNLFLGTDHWYSKGKNRILLKPNVTSLQNQDILPTDIEKVELLLTEYEHEGSDSTAIIDAYVTNSPWSMFSVTWEQQPSISTKKDTTTISTTLGQKVINVTNAFIDIYKNLSIAEKGILLKINAETEKAIIFWAHGCDIAPAPPICSGINDRPSFNVTIKSNTIPELCSLKTPS